eukprot:Hpha_TRINITY_DN1891_c0_g1::TRINITY_DN1891_c0_g1_i1::g.170458::m.170458
MEDAAAMRRLVADLRNDPHASAVMRRPAGVRSARRPLGNLEGDLHDRRYVKRHDVRAPQQTNGLHGAGLSAIPDSPASVSTYGRRHYLRAFEQQRGSSGLAGPGLVASKGPAPPSQHSRRGPSSSMRPQGHIVGGCARVDPSADMVPMSHAQKRSSSAPCPRERGGHLVRAAIDYSQYGVETSLLTPTDKSNPPWARLGRRHIGRVGQLEYPDSKAHKPQGSQASGTPRHLHRSATFAPSPRQAHVPGFGCIPVDPPGARPRPRCTSQSPMRKQGTGAAAWDPPPPKPRLGRRALQGNVEQLFGQGAEFLSVPPTTPGRNLSPAVHQKREYVGPRRAHAPNDSLGWFHGGLKSSAQRSTSVPARLGKRLDQAGDSNGSRDGTRRGLPPVPGEGDAGSVIRGRRRITPSDSLDDTHARFRGVCRSHTPQPRVFSVLVPPQPMRQSSPQSVTKRTQLRTYEGQTGHFTSPAAMAKGDWAPLTRQQ